MICVYKFALKAFTYDLNVYMHVCRAMLELFPYELLNHAFLDNVETYWLKLLVFH